MARNNTGEVQDSDWVRHALFLPERGNGVNVRSARVDRSQQWSGASLSFSDTSLGGNQSMNPPPQYNKNTDPRIRSLIADRADGTTASPTRTMGMGRKYQEMIDSKQRRIFMQFGVPAFNSLTNFFTMFYDHSQGRLANTGQVEDLFYSFAKYTSYLVLWEVHAVLSVTSFLYSGYRYARNQPMSKFYYMKPAQPLFWSSTTVMMNALAVNMGLAQAADGKGKNSEGKNPSGFGGTKEDIETMHKLLPYIFKSDTGGIDFRAVANRYQMLANAHNEALADILEKYTSEEDLAAKLDAHFKTDPKEYFDEKSNMTTREYLDAYLGSAGASGEGLSQPMADYSSYGEAAAATDRNVATAIRKAKKSRDEESGLFNGMAEHLSKFWEFTNAERKAGSDFVSFIVGTTDSSTMSWTNTTKSSEIADTMNRTSSEAKSKIFNLAGGNLGDGVVAGAVEFVGGAMKSMASGLLDSFGLTGLHALGGQAFVDMPEFHDSSTTGLPVAEYTMEVRSPYGDSVSILTNIMPTIAMVLAAGAPRSTGANSYTGPFLCKVWDQGVNKIELGMVTSIVVTVKDWNVKMQPLAVDISFTVSNLSKMTHVPISNEVGISEALRMTMFEEPNNFTDLMGTLAGLSMNDQYYFRNRHRLNMARRAENFDNWLSISNLVGSALDTTPGSLIKAMSADSAR